MFHDICVYSMFHFEVPQTRYILICISIYIYICVYTCIHTYIYIFRRIVRHILRKMYESGGKIKRNMK